MGRFKASSVTAEGQPDGWSVPLQWEAQVSPGGVTRLVVSTPAARLSAVHRAMVDALLPPLSVRYVQLTDRGTATQHPHQDRPSWVAVELDPDRVLEVFRSCAELLYLDGRHQLWVRGSLGDQVVLDELGLLYAYPDDPAMRDVLLAQGVPEDSAPTMLERDYVKVEFSAGADAEEERLIGELGLQPFAG